MNNQLGSDQISVYAASSPADTEVLYFTTLRFLCQKSCSALGIFHCIIRRRNDQLCKSVDFENHRMF